MGRAGRFATRQKLDPRSASPSYNSRAVAYATPDHFAARRARTVLPVPTGPQSTQPRPPGSEFSRIPAITPGQHTGRTSSPADSIRSSAFPRGVTAGGENSASPSGTEPPASRASATAAITAAHARSIPGSVTVASTSAIRINLRFRLPRPSLRRQILAIPAILTPIL
ncbi:MAG: hypothetical protein II943_00505 [Victivallales bacterium]|nr:hypothetical protein [Victivallales bacterium]